MTDTRWCPHCQAQRPLTEFYVNKAAASGIDGYCKTYRKLKNQERAEFRKARIREERARAGGPAVLPKSPHRIDDGGRECITCRQYKPWIDYHLDRSASTGHQAKCKSCTRHRQMELSSTEEGREAARRRTADWRARRRGPEWTARQVTRHAQLDCDGYRHRCTQCGAIKEVHDFPGNRETPCGYDPRCTSCRHTRRVERRALNHNDILTKEKMNWSLTKYGITADDYFWLLELQGGGCALCGATASFSVVPSGVKSRLSVDHEHAHCGPGRGCRECVRGLLCHDCNFGLGKFEYRPRTRQLFAVYLDRRPLLDR